MNTPVKKGKAEQEGMLVRLSLRKSQYVIFIEKVH
jgi:hypothetical protein